MLISLVQELGAKRWSLIAARMPGEQHPGQTASEGKMHDRIGSQIERERHQYPGSSNPKSGSGRSNKRPKGKK